VPASFVGDPGLPDGSGSKARDAGIISYCVKKGSPIFRDPAGNEKQIAKDMVFCYHWAIKERKEGSPEA